MHDISAHSMSGLPIPVNTDSFAGSLQQPLANDVSRQPASTEGCAPTSKRHKPSSRKNKRQAVGLYVFSIHPSLG